MRLFWIMVALLAIVAGFLFLRPGKGAPVTDSLAAPPNEPVAAAPVAQPEPATKTPEADARPADPTDTGAAAPQEADLDLDAAIKAAGESVVPTATTAPATTPETPAEYTSTVAAVTPAVPVLDSTPPATPAPAETPTPAANTGSLAATALSVNTPAPVVAPAASGEVVTLEGAGEARVTRRPDGSYLIDDKYPLRGGGTRDNPYQITWDYLLSAQETYQPRLGQKKLPDRVKLLSGKHVKITGYVAFPIIAQEATEMLMMLNQWDGCCIGVPPTPYDAVEVRLRDPAAPEQRLVIYGSVRGKMTVEPYLVKDWLVSLYAMEDAVLVAEE